MHFTNLARYDGSPEGKSSGDQPRLLQGLVGPEGLAAGTVSRSSLQGEFITPARRSELTLAVGAVASLDLLISQVDRSTAERDRDSVGRRFHRMGR